jgi:DNA-binding NarL/FixJ family response regulator
MDTRRILIADDHGILRAGIRGLMGQAFPTFSCTEAGTFDEVLRELAAAPCDVAILDLKMPGANVDAVRVVHERFPHTKVLVLTMHSADEFAVPAMDDGASGFLNKGCSTSDMIVAIEALLRGKRYISDEVAALLESRGPRQSGHPGHQGLDALSDRELQIAIGVARGETYKDIAVRLCIRSSTVGTYRERIFEKLHLGSTADLVRYMVHHHPDMVSRKST